MILFSIILATFIISLGSLVGLLPVFFQKRRLHYFLIYLVALSAGTLIGDAFLHLLPEAAELMSADALFLTVLLSFIGFFMVEKVFHWRHCHTDQCEDHSFGTMNLMGDSIHNFIDGLIIAGAFVTDFRLGVLTTFAVALHEIPQEIGDFGVLLHAGWSKKNALIANLGTAFWSVAGGLSGYFLAAKTDQLISYLLPIAAGGFIYIAASDLIPELRKDTDANRTVRTALLFLAGVVLMYLLKFVE